MRKPPMKYADGGKIIAPKKNVKRVGDTMQSTRVGSTADSLRNRRKQQEAALGLADGGPVMPKPERGRKPKRITTKNPPGGPRPR